MELKDCTTREQVEQCLALYDFGERVSKLLEAMDNPIMTYSCQNVTDEQKYEMCLVSFLSGEWKYGEMLKEHGL